MGNLSRISDVSAKYAGDVYRPNIRLFRVYTNCILIRDSNRIDSIHLTNRFESPKWDRSIRPQLVGVCMQSLPTLTVCTLYAGITPLGPISITAARCVAWQRWSASYADCRSPRNATRSRNEK